jgi:hypothetical protein
MKPTPTPTPTIEERSIRSERTRVALRIFLQRCAVRMGVETLVLVDGQGRSVVCTDETLDAEAAARHAAALYRDGVRVPDTSERAQQAWPVELGGDEGFLLALGKPAISSAEMTETREGIARILSHRE